MKTISENCSETISAVETVSAAENCSENYFYC